MMAFALCLGWPARAEAAPPLFADLDLCGVLPCEAFAPPKTFAKVYATLDVYGDYAPKQRDLSPHSGGMSPSYIGFVGGTNATKEVQLSFALENLIDVVHASWATSKIGDRKLFGRMTSPWGNVTVGRQFTLHLWVVGAEIDPLQLGFNSSPYIILSAGIDSMIRTDAVTYETPRWHGLGTAVMVSRDAQLGNAPPASDDVSVRFDYRDDKLYLGGVFVDQREYMVRHARRIMAYGGNYTLGPLTVTGGVQRVTSADADLTFTEAMGGARLVVGDHQLFGSAGWSRGRVAGTGAQLYGVAYAYSLTKSFTAYVAGARLVNAAESNFALNFPVPNGATTDDVIFGVRLRL